MPLSMNFYFNIIIMRVLHLSCASSCNILGKVAKGTVEYRISVQLSIPRMVQERQVMTANIWNIRWNKVTL